MSRRTLLFLRLGVFIAACGFLYVRLAKHGDPAGVMAVLNHREPGGVVGALAILMLLMVVNWSLESLKWRVLMREIEPISFGRAFVATIAGTSIGLITPNRVGEFVGRVLFLAPENRIPASFATAVGSIAQFVVTLICGSLAFAGMFATMAANGTYPQMIAVLALCVLVSCGALLLYFSPELLHQIIARVPVLRRWEKHAAVLDRVRSRTLVLVLSLSVLRYMVFTGQFVLILVHLAGVHATDALQTIPVAFLVSTLIPTVMLTELGVRGSVAMAVIASDPSQDRAVFIASTLLWMVNIALPAMAGAVILLVARIRAARA